MLIIVGIVTAIITFVLVAFLAITATSTKSDGPVVATQSVIAATKDIPAHTVLAAADLTLRTVPVDPAFSKALTKPEDAVGRITAVAVVAQQPILSSFLLSTQAGGSFNLTDPAAGTDPTASWRAVSISVPDERAVGGQVNANQFVDIWLTVQANPPADPTVTNPGGSGQNYADKTTGLVYQNVLVLARNGDLYVLKVDVATATEINHLNAAGNALFSFALRSEADTKPVTDTKMSDATTNEIIKKYNLPIPKQYP
jgi:Flp pilus assembly protein CpaB